MARRAPILTEGAAPAALPSGAPAGPHAGAYRPPAIGFNGVATAAHGLAATAGLRVLLQGGNAVDAAVAVGAALGVVEPFMSGLGGGGGFMLIHEGRTGAVHALDYLGAAPAAVDPAAFASLAAVDADVRSSVVPGTLAGWLAAHERFGTLGRAALFQPAIDLAERGWAVSPFAAMIFADYAPRVAAHPTARRLFWPHGRPPRVGEVLSQPDLADTYRAVVEGGADVFYRGALARRLARAVREAGGWLSEADLDRCQARWLEPLAIDYRGYHVYSVPPPSSGFQYLASLKILEDQDLAALGHNAPAFLHLVIETIKLASSDRTRYAHADTATIRTLVSPAYAAERRTHIDGRRAQPSEGERYQADKTVEVAPGDPGRYARDHTTHFEVADRWGNLVAVTQSNGASFGNGFVAADTGFAMNNFLYWTDLAPDSPIFMRPGAAQREIPMAPCIVTRDGQPVLGIGTPGSYGILQTTLQMLVNVLDFRMDVQAAIEAPRVRAFEGTRVEMEARIPQATRDALAALGHDVHVLDPWTWRVGGAHGITRKPRTGLLAGGADPRRDGQAVAF